ncbi:hypothetical protein ABL78_1586 [Leptomonas seymouri]|uniref:Uncharacterized protein n=1 Tax=Leptomonas seymouri TaxID=5684 RepID=A0A0N1IM21_LEPSE|nr:hypothetical protein ABL78_1586 [Leptomonas seymouri]|eukprot:KPI89253.1 hypothetical protein ABL78_1586 [Leptomonas seymouri]
MDPAQFQLNGQEMRHQWRVYHQRQYQYRLAARFIIRLAVWLLSVYLVQQWSFRAVPYYLALSMILLAVAVAYGEDASGRVAPATSGEHGAGARARHDTGEHADQEEVDEDDDGVGHAPALQQGGAVRRRGKAAARKSWQRNAVLSQQAPSTSSTALQSTAPASEKEIPTFDGVLTPAQQRLLLLAMQQLRTPGATRCAMDACFRRTLVSADLDESVTCVCGSGAKFGACCAPVKDELLAIMEER